MKLKKFFVVLSAVLCVFILISCSKDSGPASTDKPQATATKGPTAVPTEAPTPAPTKEPLPAGELGLPSDKSEVVFTTDFSGDELDELVLSKDDAYSIKDGKLYISSRDNGETFGGWTTITPDVDCYPKDAYQWEFHIDFQSYYPADTGDAPWMATIIGARVANYTSAIADMDDGIWVGFTHRNSVTVYPSGSSTGSMKWWPAGAVTVSIPEGFSEMRKLVIVDTGDSLYYYMTTSANERVLILKIDITEDNIIVYDGQGNEKKKVDNYLDMEEGNHFKIFNHMAAAVVDSMTIKAY